VISWGGTRGDWAGGGGICTPSLYVKKALVQYLYQRIAKTRPITEIFISKHANGKFINKVKVLVLAFCDNYSI
jgi:hypothetical protein